MALKIYFILMHSNFIKTIVLILFCNKFIILILDPYPNTTTLEPHPNIHSSMLKSVHSKANNTKIVDQ